MNRIASHLMIPLALLAFSCDDGVGTGVPADVDGFGGDTMETDVFIPPCTPNLDGVLTADEMFPALGVPASYTIAQNLDVDVVGTDKGDGTRAWDWSWSSASEQKRQLWGEPIAGKWYASEFSEGAFVVPFDLAGKIDSIYSYGNDGLNLLGLASTEENPTSGKILMHYSTVVQLFKFPMQKGDSWISKGTVRNSTFAGLPYAGQDTYQVDVDELGELSLPDFTFKKVLRVRTHVTVQPTVGASTSRQQISYVFECFGEVARATSQAGELYPNFTNAAEVRRLGL